MVNNNLLKDRNGIKYKYPERSCKNCIKYPCFIGIENCICNLAKYGCILYKNIKKD